MRVAYAVMSVGLGHATRSLPLIKAIIENGHQVTVISDSMALAFLKNELKGKVSFIRLKDYSFQTRFLNSERVSVRRFLANLPIFFQEYLKEQRAFKKLHKQHKFHTIISDSRYGIYRKNVPSYLISHHIKNRIKTFEKLSDVVTELSMLGIFLNYNKLLIPDFVDRPMAGSYAHGFRFLQAENVKYLGILSMVKKQNIEQDIDYFFSISGPKYQRKVMEKTVLKQLPAISDKRVVITLGDTKNSKVKRVGNAEIFGCLDSKAQSRFMNRAKLVIARSGYSTIMDLIELGKKALLIPTKGLPEQEYLARFHQAQGHFHSVSIDKLCLERDLRLAQTLPGVSTRRKTKSSVKLFLKETGL
jgi:uncharacterized protein (TIGR00661 family)